MALAGLRVTLAQRRPSWPLDGQPYLEVSSDFLIQSSQHELIRQRTSDGAMDEDADAEQCHIMSRVVVGP